MVQRARHDGTALPGQLVQSNCRGERIRRQDFAPADSRWEEDGAVFVARQWLLASTGSRLGGRIELYENERTVDIDTERDLAVADALVRTQGVGA